MESFNRKLLYTKVPFEKGGRKRNLSVWGRCLFILIKKARCKHDVFFGHYGIVAACALSDGSPIGHDPHDCSCSRNLYDLSQFTQLARFLSF